MNKKLIKQVLNYPTPLEPLKSKWLRPLRRKEYNGPLSDNKEISPAQKLHDDHTTTIVRKENE